MSSLNKVILIGNLGKDPEIKTFLTNGSIMAWVSLATSEKYLDKESEEYKYKPEWHKIVFFGNLAKIVQRYLKKGSKIFVEGSLKTRKWQDKNDQTRYTTEIVAKYMQMLDGKSQENEAVEDDMFADLEEA